MEFGFWDIAQIFGALAFFIYGMKIMSDGIQRAAGSQMRSVLRSMTKNRFLGVFTGFLITALLQSSSATTVMAVSFVNAGLLTLMESAGVLMGANIGTTITAWIISILGFKVKLNLISIPLFAVGFPMTFVSKGKVRHWGEFIIGFAILFLGLGFLKDSVPDLKGNPEVLNFLMSFTNWGIFSTIFFVFVGTIITIIVQSSSAAMAITLAMCINGWLPFEVAAAMVLGENIGTTITANIAAMVGNREAKRAARLHTIINLTGVVWMVFMMPYFLDTLTMSVQNISPGFDPYNNPGDMTIGLSTFHTAFNVFNVILLVGFIPGLVKMAQLWVPASTDEEENEGQLRFIGTTVLTPELATFEVQKEVAHFGEITAKMSGFAKALINSTDANRQNKMLKKLKKYEDITDRLEIEITEYVTKMTNQEITRKTGVQLRSMLNICNDLERIGDIYYQMSKTIERKIEDKAYFLPEQRNNLNEMINAVDQAFSTMVSNLNATSYDNVTIEKATTAEKEINSIHNRLRKENSERIGSEDYSSKTAMIYNNLFSSLEQVGNHIINVSESINGDI